jgi:hypothetical protein
LKSTLKLACLVLSSLLIGACGGGGTEPDPADTSASSTSTAAGEPEPDDTCLAPTFTVERPEGWQVNDPAEAAPCRYFDDEDFSVPENSEAVAIAIHLGYDDVPFERASQRSAESQEEIDRRTAEVDGLEAVRIHARSTGLGLLDAGTELVTWVVDAGEQRSFSATTIEVAGDFEANVEVLDEMVETIDFTVEEACSAVEQIAPVAEEDLAEPVAETKGQIVIAALACDYDRLAEIAPDDGFTFSYGGSTDFAAFLREGEEPGADPLRKLIQIAGTTPRPFEIRDEKHTVWPAAAAYEGWDEVPEEAIDELRPIYTAEELQSFAEAEQYLGYRMAIGADGAWLYFVAGD